MALVALLVSAWIEISLFCKETIADEGCSGYDLYAFLAEGTQVNIVSILTEKYLSQRIILFAFSSFSISL